MSVCAMKDLKKKLILHHSNFNFSLFAFFQVFHNNCCLKSCETIGTIKDKANGWV